MPSTIYPPQTEREQLQWLQLTRTPGIGPVTFRSLLHQYNDPVRALKFLEHHPRRTFNIPSEQSLIQERDRLHRLDGQMIFLGNPDYPPLLAQTLDPPPILSIVGRKELLVQPMLAVVGTRRASQASLHITQTLIAGLKQIADPMPVIVSGMALGIDQAAHRASLSSSSVGVLAHGLSVEYPPKCGDLFAQMRQQGALISECSLEERPTQTSFPRRNRIIAGLALATMVVEAAVNSGSMITANFAAQYGRDILAVPQNPSDNRSSGVNGLLRDGAAVITSAQDIQDTLATLPRGFFDAARQVHVPTLPFDEFSEDSTLTDNETLAATILDRVGPVPCSVNELIETLDASPQQVIQYLVDCELNGTIEFVAGGKVVRLYT